MLWALVLAVLLAMTVAIPLLYLPALQLAGSAAPSPLPATDPMDTLIGLGGLVVIFCLYVLLKQREIDRTREKLEDEERARREIRTRLSELSALFQVSTTLNLQLRLEAVLEIIVRRVVATLHAQQASVMLVAPEDGMLETRASYGLESEFARNARKKLGEGIAGWVAQHQQGVLIAQRRPGGPFVEQFKSDRNISSSLSLPLRVGDRCVGVLNVNRINHPEPFEEQHREMLQIFAEHVGSVVERAQALERLSLRARELEAANHKLSELNRLKDVFLSTASHELKTPLTTVIAYAELLEENDDRLHGAQRSEFLQRLRSEAHRLMGLIEDILDLSRLESGKLTLHRRTLSVGEVVRGAAETTRPIAERREVEVQLDLDETLPALELDEVKMRQVVVNLLANAIKFSPAGGRVLVITRREPRWAVIEVSDQGPGIAPEETAHIFEMFGQGVRAAEQGGGLGIGLHLVKRISELHGAHVGVNPAPGGGSTFWVRLPLAPAVAADAEPERRAA
jgi:signal transduction histidine kinase